MTQIDFLAGIVSNISILIMDWHLELMEIIRLMEIPTILVF